MWAWGKSAYRYGDHFHRVVAQIGSGGIRGMIENFTYLVGFRMVKSVFWKIGRGRKWGAQPWRLGAKCCGNGRGILCACSLLISTWVLDSLSDRAIALPPLFFYCQHRATPLRLLRLWRYSSVVTRNPWGKPCGYVGLQCLTKGSQTYFFF